MNVSLTKDRNHFQSGAALLIVMALSVLLASISLISTQKFQFHLGMQKTVEARHAIKVIHADIRGVLGDRQSCTETIKEVTLSEIDGSPIFSIKGPSGQELYRVNVEISGGTKISRMEFSTFTPIDFITGTAKISLFFQQRASGGIGSANTQSKKDITLKIDRPPLEAKQLALGKFHTCALFTNEKVKCWGGGRGGNNQGQLGYGDRNPRGYIIDELGENLPFVDLGSDASGSYKATAISSGNQYTCAILNVQGKGRVKCWGSNSSGQLGQGDHNSRGDGTSEMGNNLPFVDLGGTSAGEFYAVLGIASGDSHSCAILDRAGKGALKCWGDNSAGQLGLGHTRNIGDDSDEMGDFLNFLDLGQENGLELEVSAVALGLEHSCAVFQNRKTKCWGSNNSGQLGLTNRSESRGDATSDMSNNLPFLDFGMINSIPLGTLAISARGNSNCVILDSNIGSRLKCWGNNYRGMLGLGLSTAFLGHRTDQMGNDLPFVDLGTGIEAKFVSVAKEFVCVTLRNGRVKCWGSGVNGQLGLDTGSVVAIGDSSSHMGDNLGFIDLGTVDGTDTGSPHRVSAVYSGFFHSCAIISGGLKCWGLGGDAALGNGSNEDIGNNAGEMGNNFDLMALVRQQFCTAIFASDGENWEYDPTNSAIFLSGTQNVGIGTDDPQEKLHVIGIMKVIGEVSAGSVVSAGPIKMQDERELNCDTTEEGTQRFRRDIMEFCNGSEWKSMGQSIWEENTNQIFIADTAGVFRNVGIGTNNPQARFHVRGNSKLENGLFKIDGNASDPNFPKALAIGGNVGVGADFAGAENTVYKLKVADGNFVATGSVQAHSIQLDSSAPECTQNKGIETIYYNESAASLQYCDGESWRSFDLE